MNPTRIIMTKRDGGTLAQDDIRALIGGYVAGDVSDYHMSAFAMAVFFRGMDPKETAALTDAMMRSGDVYDLAGIARPLIDKHSTGGVGDKISLMLAPLAAACGLAVPMVSGRGLGHTGGTLDKLESIPGFRVQLPFDEFKKLVGKIGMAMSGQTKTFVPADGKLYALRDVTATVESIPLIVASILSKKIASGAKGIVMDVKTGSGAFMPTKEKSQELAEALEATGAALGVRVKARLTDMSQPLGGAIGNTLEVLEALDTLRGGGPADTRELTLRLCADMIELGGLASGIEALKLAESKLDDGSALEIFTRMVAEQGGDASVVSSGATLGWRGTWKDVIAYGSPSPMLDLTKLNAGPMKLGAHREIVYPPQAGVLRATNAKGIGLASCELGAGRIKTTDAVDHGVGIVMLARVGDKLATKQPLAVLFHNDRGVEAAKRMLLDSVTVN